MRAPGEPPQQADLRFGKPDGTPVADQFAPARIKHARPQAQARSSVRRLLRGPPEDGLNPQDQLLGLKGFGQIVVRTASQALYPIPRLTSGGQHQDGEPARAAGSAPQPGDKGQAVLPGHHHVQDRQIEIQRINEPPGRLRP